MAIFLLASADYSLGPMIGRWRCKAYTVKAGYTASAVIQSDFLKDRKGMKLKTLNYLQGQICFMLHGNGTFQKVSSIEQALSILYYKRHYSNLRLTI